MEGEVKCTEHLPYYFAAEEKLELAGQLARKNEALDGVEERRKQVTSDFKAQTDACRADITRLSRLLTNGYEYRDIECIAKLHVPKVGEKTIVRMDTGEFVKVVQMTASECQEHFVFGVKDNPPPEPEFHRGGVVGPLEQAKPEAIDAEFEDVTEPGIATMVEWRTAEEIRAGVPRTDWPKANPAGVYAKKHAEQIDVAPGARIFVLRTGLDTWLSAFTLAVGGTVESPLLKDQRPHQTRDAAIAAACGALAYLTQRAMTSAPPDQTRQLASVFEAARKMAA